MPESSVFHSESILYDLVWIQYEIYFILYHLKDICGSGIYPTWILYLKSSKCQELKPLEQTIRDSRAINNEQCMRLVFILSVPLFLSVWSSRKFRGWCSMDKLHVLFWSALILTIIDKLFLIYCNMFSNNVLAVSGEYFWSIYIVMITPP